PVEPIKGLMSKEYAKERAKLVNAEHNDAHMTAGDPYPFQGETNPLLDQLKKWPTTGNVLPPNVTPPADASNNTGMRAFYAGTTSVEAADEEGWVVSVTPSGGWIPAVVAGRTGVGLSQRMQSFVLDAAEGPFNVLEPGKHPRVTLTPTLALKNGQPFLCFSV